MLLACGQFKAHHRRRAEGAKAFPWPLPPQEDPPPPWRPTHPEDKQYRSSSAFGSWHAAPSQAAIGGCPATAADDLKLFLRPVCPVQKFLDELLKAHFGIGFTGRRLLQELVDLDHLPERRGKSWTNGAASDGNVK